MSARIEDVLAEHRLMFWTVDHVWGEEPESSRTAPRCSCGVLRSGGGSRESWASQVEWWERHVATALRADVMPEVLKGGFNDGYASARRFYERAGDSPAPVASGDGGARPEAGGEASSPGVVCRHQAWDSL